MGKKTRMESDSMGSIEVEADRYWGAQTQRALHYFCAGNEKIPIEMIHAMATVKKAAARANRESGKLEASKAVLIEQAASEVTEGKLDTHFPLHVWMSGSGTQSNMNVNEVIANRAIEISGGEMGSKTPIHPNDDVNMSQSTNDVFPTAMNITTVLMIKRTLLPAVTIMRDELQKKSQEWSDVIKVGRTHMQDAVPMTLGQEFSGYAVLLDEHTRRLETALNDLYKLAIGGTAVGTGLNAPEGFAELCSEKVAELTGLPFISAPNKFAVQGSHDALVAASGVLKNLSGSLFKIANDIRLLSCGPRAGFYELLIPSNEPGSSIMPGKVNPTQCEAMAMAAVQVMGYDSAVSMAGSGGYLEMNVYKPVMIYNIVQSVHLLSQSCLNFTRFLLEKSMPNRETMERFVQDSLMPVTALSPVIGYDKASQLAHYADKNNCSLREANAVFGFISQEEFDKITDLSRMAKPK